MVSKDELKVLFSCFYNMVILYPFTTLSTEK